MNDLSDDDRSALANVEKLIADANVAGAKATSIATGLETKSHPAGSFRLTREDVRVSYLKTPRPLDYLESLIGHFDDGHGTPMPRQITCEHVERIKDDYDGLVRNLALMLLEFNHRKWLQRKPDIYGAQQVKRHSLTDNQREWLNSLREAWCEHDNPSPDRPEVVCLYGSTRFKDEYCVENHQLTLEGKIILSVELFRHADDVEFDEDRSAILTHSTNGRLTSPIGYT